MNDRVFLLDVSDVTNEAYGYAPDRGWNIWIIPKSTVPNRVKGGMFNYWWLRSSAADDAGCAGDVNCGGILNLIGADILFYGDLDSSSGTFLLPNGCDLSGWGRDYHVYILAENMGGAMETDYASAPVPVNASEN